MRKGPAFRYDDKNGSNVDFTVDWKEDPTGVMAGVNGVLENFGLEAIYHETDGDFYAFSIRKIKPRKTKKD